MTTDDNHTWHPGEISVQSRAGVMDKMAALGPRLIRDFMPDQHREFFNHLPMIIVGAEDGAGCLWAAPLFGEPGFIRTPSPSLLTVSVSAPYPHPLFSHLQVNSQVGLLGIEFESRRRNRANGVVAERTSDKISIAVQQSFGNCPKYIHRRRMLVNPQHGKIRTEAFSSWNGYLRKFITTADTCFIASVCPGSQGKHNRGIDVSHRGGEPGFIRFDHQQRLLIPDYPGNHFFNTLGNLAVDSQAGLLFLDFSGGHIVSFTATAEVLWKIDEPTLCEDNDRVIRLTLETGYVAYHALPYLWTAINDLP